MKLRFLQKVLRVLCGNIEQHRRSQFDGGLLQTTSAIPPGSKSSCLLLSIVLHDEVTEPENADVHVQLQTKILLITSGWR